MEDERFKHILTDPKFRNIPKKARKIKIDKRFHGMFKDENFKVKYTVDKRGRPVNHSSNSDLKRYYDMSSDDSDKSDEDDLNESGKYVRTPKIDTSDLDKTLDGDKITDKDVKKKLKNLKVDYARGEGVLNSESSSDDDEQSDEDTDDSDIEHRWGELDRDAEHTEESTKRIAVCNQDWDRIRAVDLMVLFNSFLPAGGLIESVTIYPSEFGLKRIKEEDLKGPTELVENNQDLDDSEGNTEGSKYHMEKLRQYQLNRLKYYYAVVVCDSIATADKLYSECDGLEYESSATKLDLRFIPDDTTFDHTPKEKCDKVPDMSHYQPRFFTNTALQQAKVELTWDETNPNRIEITKKLSEGKIDDITDADLQDYLASSSGEESDDANFQTEQTEKDSNPIEKYRALLNDLEKTNKEKENKDVEMEISWDVNMKKDTEKLVKKKLAENEVKTPFQQYLDKRKEKKKLKKELKKQNNELDESVSEDDIDMNDPFFAEEFNSSEFKKKKEKKKQPEELDDHDKAQLELLLLNNDDEKGHFNFKKIEHDEKSSKKKKKKHRMKNEEVSSTTNDDFQVDVKDARFSAIFTSHLYNIDPTDSHYRKTKGMNALIEEKQKRVGNQDQVKIDPPPKKKSKHADLNALVNSVKMKTKDLIKRK